MPAVIRWSLLAPFLLAAVVSAQDRGILDLNDLANYANQPVPTYITKDNTPADNPLTNSGATLRRRDRRLRKLSSAAERLQRSGTGQHGCPRRDGPPLHAPHQYSLCRRETFLLG